MRFARGRLPLHLLSGWHSRASHREVSSLVGRPLDLAYCQLGAANGLFFQDGWGQLSTVDYDVDYADAWPHKDLQLHWRKLKDGNWRGTNFALFEGTFRSPAVQRILDATPSESHTGRVQLLVPTDRLPVALRKVLPFAWSSNSGGSGTQDASVSPVVDSRTTAQSEGSQSSSASTGGDDAVMHRCSGSGGRVPTSISNDSSLHGRQDVGEFDASSSSSSSSSDCDINSVTDVMCSRSHSLHPRDSTGRNAVDYPFVLHLAATGDHGFERRLSLSYPLLIHGMSSLILESPYYGARKPPKQRGAKLRHVNDMVMLGSITIHEGLCLLRWALEHGFGPLGLCGVSMGAVHASMIASLYPGEVALIGLLAPRSASIAFCDGAFQSNVAWRSLLPLEDICGKNVAEIVAKESRECPRMRAAQHLYKKPIATTVAAQEQHQSSSEGSFEPNPSPELAPGWISSSEEASRSATETTIQQVECAGQDISFLDPQLSSTTDQQHMHGIHMPPPHNPLQHATVHRHVQAASTMSDTLAHFGLTQARTLALKAHAAAAASQLSATISAQLPATTKAASDLASELSAKISAQLPSAKAAADALSARLASELAASAALIKLSEMSASLSSSARASMAKLSKQLPAGLSMLALTPEEQALKAETMHRLRDVLETYTDVTRYPSCRRPDAAIFMAAMHDAYVHERSTRELHQHFPGSELRLVPGGHVSAFLQQQQAFHQAIVDSMARVAQLPTPKI